MHNTSLKILVVGQGIAGTMLSWYLHQAGIPFVVADDDAPNTASKVAAGVINPVTGRRIVTTWMIDELMPFAVKAYEDIGNFLNINLVHKLSIADCFPTLQMHEAFTQRVAEQAPYLTIHNATILPSVHQYYGYGTISPAYVINVALLLSTWKKYLLQQGMLVPAQVDQEQVSIFVHNCIYNHQSYTQVLFANGVAGVHNKWFKNLPFAPNKGEAFIIHAPELSPKHIYKKGYTIVPIGNAQYWVGANYEWNYTNALPTTAFYNNTIQLLNSWLTVPYTIVHHIASTRPATIERRPFVGLHPTLPVIGILNGLGAKGTSLAPYFAHQLVQHIVHGIPILPQANVQRFAKVLSM